MYCVVNAQIMYLVIIEMHKSHSSACVDCFSYIQCISHTDDSYLIGQSQRESLKFHTKYFTHTLKDVYYINRGNFKGSYI